MTDILKLAKKAGVYSDCTEWTIKESATFVTTHKAIEKFYDLTREQHTKELIGAGVEPFGWRNDLFDFVVQQKEKPKHPAEGWEPCYTTEQFSARVAQMQAEIDRERESRKAAQIENESLKAELARRDDRKAKVAQLERELKNSIQSCRDMFMVNCVSWNLLNDKLLAQEES